MLFQRMTSLEVLEQAWDKVYRNAGAAGGDGVTVRWYAEDVAIRLMRLQRDLRAGSYVPGPVRRLQVPKRTGGTRELAIPCVNDRVAQTAAGLVLGPLLDGEMEESSYGYRPGRSVRMAVDRVSALRRQGYTWVVDGDIARYFDSVPHDRMLARLERSVDDALIMDVVAIWLDSFSPHGKGLPQGAPISPLLANLYLDDIDERIDGSGVRLVRFADDFLLMCKDQAGATAAQGRMRDLLAEHGLRLNPEKTRVVPFEQGFRFLGHLFVKSVVLKELRDDDEAALDNAPALAAELAAPAEEDMAGLDGLEEARGSPGLRVLYVMEPGRRLGLDGQSFIVSEDGEAILGLPPARVDRIELGPAVEASDDALRHAVATETPVAWVDGYGRTIGVLAPRPWDSAGLQAAQARFLHDPPLRLDLARRFVDGRLRNQRALLHRLNRRRQDERIEAALAGLNRTIRKLPIAGDVPHLMGFEGEGAALYWPALGRTLEHDWKLLRRDRRPPPDPVNLALSMLAGLLGRDLEALAARAGLHPGFGVLHTARDDNRACVYDLMEEFRAPLVEGLAVYLFNNRILGAAMFQRMEDGACHIDPDGRCRLIRGWESWLARPVKSPRSGHRVAWRRLMAEQVAALVRHIRDDEAYLPYVMDY